MKITRNLGLAAALAAALGLAGCFDGGGSDDPVAPSVASTVVPGSAGASSTAFVGYLASLSASDDTSEPLTVDATFAVPPDETEDPQPLT